MLRASLADAADVSRLEPFELLQVHHYYRCCMLPRCLHASYGWRRESLTRSRSRIVVDVKCEDDPIDKIAYAHRLARSVGPLESRDGEDDDGHGRQMRGTHEARVLGRDIRVERSNTATATPSPGRPLVCFRCNIDPLASAALKSTRASSRPQSGQQAADRTQSRAFKSRLHLRSQAADPPPVLAEGSAYASLASSTSPAAASPAARGPHIIHYYVLFCTPSTSADTPVQARRKARARGY